MQISPEHLNRLQEFLQRTRDEIYPEPPSDVHTGISRKMFEYCKQKISMPRAMKVLDVGCGQGVALEIFREHGHQPTGITLGEEDIAACRSKGFEALSMDQSFLDFSDASFDFVWCRHCIEHSVFPLFTLLGFHRVLKPGGWLYVEVPAPDTIATHHLNPNRYSVFGKSAWTSLIARAHFSLLDVVDIQFPVKVRERATGAIKEGPDLYWAYIAQKKKVQF